MTNRIIGITFPIMKNDIQQALSIAIIKLLRPLVRILLRNGVAFGSFSDLAKKVYTDVAFNEFSLDGKKQTVSRVSILTGLTRKEVKRLHELEAPESFVEEKRYNRAIRVISGWLNDQHYISDDSIPIPLHIDGEHPSFSSLVKSYSGDVPVQAMLNELIAANSVEQRDDMVFLIRHAYIPSGDNIENIHILGNDAAELIATIDHNLTSDSSDLRFQRKVSNQKISADSLTAFKKMSSKESQILLERLDQWLTDHEQDNEDINTTSAKVSLGIYYYEEQNTE